MKHFLKVNVWGGETGILTIKEPPGDKNFFRIGNMSSVSWPWPISISILAILENGYVSANIRSNFLQLLAISVWVLAWRKSPLTTVANSWTGWKGSLSTYIGSKFRLTFCYKILLLLESTISYWTVYGLYRIDYNYVYVQFIPDQNVESHRINSQTWSVHTELAFETNFGLGKDLSYPLNSV